MLFTAPDFVKAGDTANLCSIDLSKVFGKVNYHGLYLLKLMKRHVPAELLVIFENWFGSCVACVKWNDVWSATFSVNFGVRQGSVLYPFLFNIYLDDVAKLNDCVNRKFIRLLFTQIMTFF